MAAAARRLKMVRAAFPAQLLIDDGTDQGLENRLAVLDFMRSHPVDDGPEYRIGLLQVLNRAFHEFFMTILT